jgi:mannose-1-phosphate guanylyltransferase/mannose-6-phosphate isomerase
VTYRIIPAIMSGGAGTRLWPLSTEAHPKQFHALAGADSLFTRTVRRVSGHAGDLSFAGPIVLCNARHASLVREHLEGVAPTALVFEPAPRNTAAVGAIAAAIGAEADPDALILLLPSDHLIADVQGFHAAIARAAPFASERIVTFGITPDRPATGYGYVKRGVELGNGVYAVEAFKEKPDAETAQRYLDAGGYSWNAGIFLFHPQTLLTEFAASAAIRDAALAALNAARRTGDEIYLDPTLFAQVPSQPLDIAVMEKTARAAVAPCSIGWADIGSWDEVWRLTPRNADGYAILGPAAAADVGKMQTSGMKAAALAGDDLVVIAATNGLLIAPRVVTEDANSLREAFKKCDEA